MAKQPEIWSDASPGLYFANTLLLLAGKVQIRLVRHVIRRGDLPLGAKKRAESGHFAATPNYYPTVKTVDRLAAREEREKHVNVSN